MIGNFPALFGFIERADMDGQAFHITQGDPGGATAYGWTYNLWRAVAPMHGVADVSLDAFKAQTMADFQPLTKIQFWNTIRADDMPAGVDVFWADFQFGSGAATRVLQAALGVPVDGIVGSQQTLPALAACPDLPGLLGEFLAARKGYYDREGFRDRWPGLYRRADDCHALALSLLPSSVAL